MARYRETSMRHVGMNREAIRTAVKNRLSIGQQYLVESSRDLEEDGRKAKKCRFVLESYSRNFAVFRHSGKKTVETFTYQELWQMLMEEKIL